ncbi:hypothetical protein ACFY2T_06000 [Streptomyces sp. NPDC001260]|uniref:hypothetical protein n=1 Tax=Streptomyces sp. NPDC001260 TaxID=3364551 RepID=UPI0036AA2FF3
MTWPAALPAAALRVMRTAAGRRALRVMVLVGGLFALGFFCGEQAHAADETPGTSSSAPGQVAQVAPMASASSTNGVEASLRNAVGRLVSAPATLVDALTASPGRIEPDAPGKPRPHAPAGHGRPGDSSRPKPSGSTQRSPKPKPTSPAGTRPAEADPAGSATPAGAGIPAGSATPVGANTPAGSEATPTHNTTPSTTPTHSTAQGVPVLGSVVEGVVRTVDEAVLRPVGDLVVTVTGGLAEVTAPIPGLPQLPSLPSLPSVPELPGTPSLPGLPGLPSVPGQTLPEPVTQPDGPGHSTASAEGSTGKRARAAASGPRLDVVGGTAHAPARGEARRAAGGAGHVQVPQAPGGDPTGVLSNRSAVDSGTPRHGDAQAVALNQRAPLRLPFGAAARANGDATRDRHRDIPVSPA